MKYIYHPVTENVQDTMKGGKIISCSDNSKNKTVLSPPALCMKDWQRFKIGNTYLLSGKTKEKFRFHKDGYDTDYVGFVMDRKMAKVEKKNMLLIQSIDPDEEYTINQIQHTCTVAVINSKDGDEDKFATCKNLEEFTYPYKYSRNWNPFRQKKELYQIIMRRGGTPLYTLWKRDKIIEFIVAIYNVLKGLELYKKNGIIHGNLNERNIVYNKETKKGFMIDFGFTSNYDDTVDKEYWTTEEGMKYPYWSTDFKKYNDRKKENERKCRRESRISIFERVCETFF